MLRRLIIFLARIRLRVKLREPFQFVGQKSNAVYYFTEDCVMKAWRGVVEKSHVSFNWMVDKECTIKKCFDKEDAVK